MKNKTAESNGVPPGHPLPAESHIYSIGCPARVNIFIWGMKMCHEALFFCREVNKQLNAGLSDMCILISASANVHTCSVSQLGRNSKQAQGS